MAEYTEIHKYADNILKDNGCDCYTYGDKEKEYCKPEEIAKDLQEVYPNGMEHPFLEVAHAILDISKPRYVKPEINADFFDFDDWGKWGICDFYPEAEEKLREVIKSGKTFNTGWHGCRKEIENMCIQKDAEYITISCSTSMDEVFEQYDLFSDFLTNEEMEKLTDELADNIREVLADPWCDFSEDSEGNVQIPVGSDFDTIVCQAEELMQKCKDRLDDYFRVCISITLSAIYGDSEETEKIIEERIAKDAPYKKNDE